MLDTTTWYGRIGEPGSVRQYAVVTITRSSTDPKPRIRALISTGDTTFEVAPTAVDGTLALHEQKQRPIDEGDDSIGTQEPQGGPGQAPPELATENPSEGPSFEPAPTAPTSAEPDQPKGALSSTVSRSGAGVVRASSFTSPPDNANTTRTVRVFFVHMNGVSQSDADDNAAWSIAVSNLGFDNSAMPVRLQMASTPSHANYTQTVGPDPQGQPEVKMTIDLERFQKPNDSYLDGVHLQRYAYNADLATLVFPGINVGNDCAGLAKYPRTVEGEVTEAFSVISLFGCFPLGHEVGHNLGALHGNPGDAPPYWLSFGQGHRVAGTTVRASDIMHYDDCPSSNPCPHKLQYSDPDDPFLNTNTPSGTATRDADRAISEISWAVSSYFPSTTNDYLWDHTGTGSHGSTTVPAGQDPEAPYAAFTGNFVGPDSRDEQFMYYPDTGQDYLMQFADPPAALFQKQLRAVDGVYRPVAGDFDGDGWDDVFWHAPGGAQDYVWWGQWWIPDFGATNQTPFSVAGSYIPTAGDFDGNGADDIFWYSASGSDYVWWGVVGSQSFSPSTQVTVPSGVEPTAGDFDGDGRDDLLLYSPSGADQISWGTATQAAFGTAPNQSSRTIASGYSIASGNFNSDSYTDIILYRPGSASDSYWWGSSTRASFDTTTATSTSISGTFHSPLSGDFTNDGIDDLYWFAFG